MKRLLVIVLWTAGLAAMGLADEIKEDRIEFGPFGPLAVYRQSPHPGQVALFVSGDGGWNLGVIEMARELASLDALVVGIDIVRYLQHVGSQSGDCAYPAADFEMLSQFVQKKFDFPGYVTPILVGYSSGATLAYAVLAQAPPNTFLGAISMGFCPDLLLPKRLCRGSGLEWKTGPKGKGFVFMPATHLQGPWVALQGTIDKVCDPQVTADFVKRVNTGRLVLLPKVGHGFSVPGNWLPEFRSEFQRIAKPTDRPPQPAGAALRGLPLVEVPAETPSGETLAVVVSGDGGWAGIDREIAGVLARHGLPVIGLNSLKYFWKKQTPETAAADLERILKTYLLAWNKTKAVLIGYSLGADVLPFMANRLPPELLDRVELVALLGPGNEFDWEFHLTDWLGGKSRSSMRVLPEAERLTAKRILCVYGEAETDSLCPQMSGGRLQVVAFRGSHHFGGNYEAIAAAILGEIGK